MSTKEMQPELADQGEGIKPLYVGLAIVFIFPVGLFLLWKHPILSRNKTWWWVGGIWSCLIFMVMANGEKATDDKRRLLLVEAEQLWDAGQHEESQSKYSEFYRSWGSGVSTLDSNEKQVFGPHLPKFYARFIQHCLDTYESQPSRYSGELKLAKEQLDYADENGVSVPADLAKRVRSTQKSIDDASDAKGKKYKAFKSVVAKIKQMPDRFASQSEREKFNKELGKVIGDFDAIPFNAAVQAEEGKWIVELYESDVQGRYEGHLVNTVDALVRFIESEVVNRR